MRWVMVLALVALFAVGCASYDSPIDDGYDFGDLSRTALQLRADYCTAAEDSELRASLGDALRTNGIPVPNDGICNEILDRLAGES